MSSLLLVIGSYKKLCEEGRPPHVRSESQTLFKVCGGRSSTSKDSSSTKTSVPAVVSQRSRGNAESTPGCCNKCLRVVVKQDNSRVFSSLFLLQWRHICDVGTVRGTYEVSDLMKNLRFFIEDFSSLDVSLVLYASPTHCLNFSCWIKTLALHWLGFFTSLCVLSFNTSL